MADVFISIGLCQWAIGVPRLPSANAFSPPQGKSTVACALPVLFTGRTSHGLQHKDCCSALPFNRVGIGLREWGVSLRVRVG